MLYRKLYEVLFQVNFANDNAYSWGICVSSRGEISMISLITTFYYILNRSESRCDDSVVIML